MASNTTAAPVSRPRGDQPAHLRAPHARQQRVRHAFGEPPPLQSHVACKPTASLARASFSHTAFGWGSRPSERADLCRPSFVLSRLRDAMFDDSADDGWGPVCSMAQYLSVAAISCARVEATHPPDAAASTACPAFQAGREGSIPFTRSTVPSQTRGHFSARRAAQKWVRNRSVTHA